MPKEVEMIWRPRKQSRIVIALASILAVLAVLAVHPVLARTSHAGGTGMMGMGPAHAASVSSFKGYYDAHLDTYLSTDVSDKAQAKELHINFSAALRSAPVSATPLMYLVQGKSAPGQVAVFGSQPGEVNYSPLWREALVTWKAGVKPVLLVRDDQTLGLAKKGKLTIRRPNIVLNCPITKVGKG